MASTLYGEHLRKAFHGGTFTGVSLREALDGIGYPACAERPHGLNSCVRLVHHVGYYLELHNRVLAGGPIEGSDKLSWHHDPVENQDDWDALVRRVFAAADTWAAHVDALGDTQLDAPFGGTDKYGTLRANLLSLLEHTQYHIGQVGMLRRLLGLDSVFTPK